MENEGAFTPVVQKGSEKSQRATKYPDYRPYNVVNDFLNIDKQVEKKCFVLKYYKGRYYCGDSQVFELLTIVTK